MSNIVPDSELISDRSVCDVGEEITFAIIENSLNIYCSCINFHDCTPLIQMFNSSITRSFPMLGIYEVTLNSQSTHDLTTSSSLKITIENQKPNVDFLLPENLYQDDLGSFIVKDLDQTDTKNE